MSYDAKRIHVKCPSLACMYKPKIVALPHLASNQFLDEGLVGVGTGLLIGGEEGHRP